VFIPGTIRLSPRGGNSSINSFPFECLNLSYAARSASARVGLLKESRTDLSMDSTFELSCPINTNFLTFARLTGTRFSAASRAARSFYS
jgi:hypothetical protein